MTSKTVASTALLLVSMFTASTAIPAPVGVDNHSFESTGTAHGTDWAELPAPGPGDWMDGNGANFFEILRLNIDPTHFPTYNTAPDGLNVLNLQATSTMSQDLSHAVNAGDVITVDFYVGESAAQSPGDVTAAYTLNGSPIDSQLVTNDAPNGDFAHKSVQWTATSSGNLGIEFSGGTGAWIDEVGVDVATAPTIRGDVNVTNWDSVYFTDPGFTYAPSANGFGSADNSLPQSDSNSYGPEFLPAGGSQTYGAGVSYAGGEAASTVGAASAVYLDPPTNSIQLGWTYSDVTASASLDLDLTGATAGTSAEGLSTGGTFGTSFDGSDTGGDDGFVGFTVDFTIDALAAGSDVDGAFGIQVDVFNFTTGDLVPVLTPFVTGTGITGSVRMTEETRLDELGDAWTFSLTAADIAAMGGSVDGTYTASFLFFEPIDPPTTNSFVVTINAFGLGEAALIPEPASFTLAVLGLVGLCTIRRRGRR